MVPKTPIAWRRRVSQQPAESPQLVEWVLVSDARIRALESWAWNGRGKAPAKLQKWLDDRIAMIETALAAPEAKAGA